MSLQRDIAHIIDETLWPNIQTGRTTLFILCNDAAAEIIRHLDAQEHIDDTDICEDCGERHGTDSQCQHLQTWLKP